VPISTDGNNSDCDFIEERQAIEIVQKSALAVFGPLEIQPSEVGGHSTESLLSKSCFNGSSRKLVKVVPPKQVGIKLGFDISDVNLVNLDS